MIWLTYILCFTIGCLIGWVSVLKDQKEAISGRLALTQAGSSIDLEKKQHLISFYKKKYYDLRGKSMRHTNRKGYICTPCGGKCRKGSK